MNERDDVELSPVKRALLAVKQLQRRLDAREARDREPIAIVGLACRFPGGADSAEALDALVRSGGDVIGAVPESRCASAPGEPATRWAGLLGDPALFDAGIFGITPREAESLDPRQRLLLEVSLHALESACTTPRRLSDGCTGVFVALSGSDYREQMLLHGDRRQADLHTVTGNANSFAAGRLAHAFDLRGPCMTVDTACSSSLVAIHLAVQSLRAGESDHALVGGVNLLLSEATTEVFGRAELLSADGRCRPFDAMANGFVRSEGCGVLLLKRLSDALRDGDPVRALIRGTAVGHDGTGASLGAPGEAAQSRVIEQALSRAGLQPSDILYIEAHGLGSPFGDAIEFAALARVFGRGQRDAPCLLGSLKGALGNAEIASGLASVIRTVELLRLDSVPAQPRFRRRNPRIDPCRALVIPTATTPWPRSGAPRRAGVNGFGLSGTHAHLVLEAPPAQPPTAMVTAACELLTLSAHTRAALHALVETTARALESSDPADLPALCRGSRIGREHRAWRTAVTGSSARQLAAGLRASVAADPATQARGVAVVFHEPSAADVMLARELIARGGAFESLLCARLEQVDPAIGERVRALIDAESVAPAQAPAHRDGIALQLALADLLRSVLGPARATFLGTEAEGDFLPCADRTALERELLRLAAAGDARLDIGAGEPWLEQLAAVYRAGVALDFAPLERAGAARLPLPPTPLEHRRHWFRPRAQDDAPRARNEARQAFGKTMLEAAALPAVRGRYVLIGDEGLASGVAAGLGKAGHEAAFARSGEELASALPQWTQATLPLHAVLDLRNATLDVDRTLRELLGLHACLAAAEYRWRRPRLWLFRQDAQGAALTDLCASTLLQAEDHASTVVLLDRQRGLAACATQAVSALCAGEHERAVRFAQDGVLSRIGPAPIGELRPRDAGDFDDAAQREHRAAIAAAQEAHVAAWLQTGSCDAAPRSALASAAVASSGELYLALRELPASRRQARCLERVLDAIAEVLGLADDQEIDPGRPLAELGLDSASAVALGRNLAQASGLHLPATVLFDHPSPGQLSDFLLERMGLCADASHTPGPARPIGRDDVAVIGIGCRLPGQVASPEALWRALLDGFDGIVEVPADRWDANALYDRDPDAAGRMNSRWLGALGQIDRFDAAFFGISPNEARMMDPQQRFLLEVSYEALEHAGIAAGRLMGSRTGVFVGFCANEFAATQAGQRELDAYTLSGNIGASAAGRISYSFGLRGPAMVVETACSSSLVSIHLALRSLQQGECELALAGGVNLVLAPEVNVALTRMRALSPSGRCASYDASADGYVRGDGCAVVVLKRLADAQRDGDRVLAIVRGSAVNQDGRSQGLMAPSGPAQADVIRDALADAGVSPDQVAYVEGHGSATPLGDPIELGALGDVYGKGRSDGRPLWVGSIKSNVGHLEAAAGIAGFLKVVLSLWHGQLAPNVHYRTPNPHVDMAAAGLAVPTEAMAWPVPGRRLGAISAFGLSGTNAHLILEAPPAGERGEPADSGAGAAHLLTLSAHSDAALRARARALLEHCEREDVALRDLAHTLNLRREHHGRRLALIARDRGELLARLQRAASAAEDELVVDGVARASRARRIVYVFPGQGSQWIGMGRELLLRSAAFREALLRCDGAIARHAGWSVVEELHRDAGESRLETIGCIQPLLFSLQVSLAALFEDLGVTPDAVVGCSMGEVAAAHVAGALSLDDAARISVRRSLILRKAEGQGAMIAVQLSHARARARIAESSDRVAVAASNSPTSSVLSGDQQAVDALLAALQSEGIFCRRIRSEVAGHCPHIDPLLPELRAALSEIAPRAPAVALYSTVDGGRLQGAMDTEYWLRNTRDPVRFCEAVEALVDDGHTTFVELSPHPLLASAIEQILESRGRGEDGLVVGSGVRDRDQWEQVLLSAGKLHVRGVPVALARLDVEGARLQSLPVYPFQRQRHWPEHARSARARGGEHHAVLGEALPPAAHRPEEQVWLLEGEPIGNAGVLHGGRVFSLATLLGLLQAACPEVSALRLGLTRVLALPPAGKEVDTGTAFQIVWDRRSKRLQVFHRDAMQPEWSELASAVAEVAQPEVACDEPPGPYEPGPSDERVERILAYAGLPSPRVSNVTRCAAGARATLAPGADRGPLLDAAVALFASTHCPALPEPRSYVPVACEQLWTRASAADDARELVIGLRAGDGSRPCIDARACDAQGAVVWSVSGLVLEVLPIDRLVAAGHDPVAALFHRVEWLDAPAPAAGTARSARRFLLLGPDDLLRDKLRGELVAAGHDCQSVALGDAPFDAQALRAVLAAGDHDDVVHMGSLHLGACARPEAIYALSCEPALVLARHLAGSARATRLWLVTRGAQPARDAPVSAAQGPLWGLGRSFSMEQPDRFGALIDLDPAGPDHEAGQLARELLDPDGEEQIALRARRRLVARLRHVELPADGFVPLRLDARRCYVITGWLGGLGVRTAHRLVSRGARRIVLLGRQGLPERARWDEPHDGRTRARIEHVRALEARGADVRVVAADVMDRGALARLIAELGDQLAGVVHAAGLPWLETTAETSPETLRAICGPKIEGTLNLHELTRDLPLDFFVLYSSGATTWGAQAESAYMAANHYLDSIAHERRRAGLPAQSIDWGYWATEEGMGGEAAEAWVRSVGMVPLASETALHALERVVHSGAAQLTVVDMRWPHFRSLYEARRARRLLDGMAAASDGDAARARRDLREELRGLTPGEVRLRLEDLVAGELAAALGHARSDELPRDLGFFQLGVDSLTAVRCMKSLKRELGCSLQTTALLQHPTIEQLAEHLAEVLGVAATTEDEQLAATSEEGLLAELELELEHDLQKRPDAAEE